MKGETTNHHSGVTLFGEALMCSINQFAYQESLHQIYNRVSFFQYSVEKLDIHYSILKYSQTCSLMDTYAENNQLISNLNLYSRPEIQVLHMRRNLYFNPGYYKQ
jgi:hypothetical protein